MLDKKPKMCIMISRVLRYHFEIKATPGLKQGRKLDDKMSFLNSLNKAFEKNHQQASKARLERMARAKEEEKLSLATFAAKYLRKVILGEEKGGYKVPAIQQATDKLFEAIHGLVPDNLLAVKEFIQEFPNRLFYQRIPDFVEKSGLSDFVAEVYMTRLLSLPNLEPCWNPSWIKEGESDSDDFFYAVVSLFASMLAVGAGENDFRRVAEAIYDSYPSKIEEGGRLEKILLSVMDKGVYYIPKSKSFPTAAEAVKEKGDDGEYQRYTSNSNRATVSMGEVLAAKGTEMPKVKTTRRRQRAQELVTA